MNYFTRILVVAGAVALSACGGGGSDGGAVSPPVNNNLQITISPATTSTTPFSLVDMPIRVQRPNGTPLPDGTTVTVQVTPPSVAQVSSLVAVGGDEAIRYGERVTATTTAGVVNFRIHSRAVGSAIVTVSAAEVVANGLTGTNQTTVNVVAGPPRDPRLTLTAPVTTLPANRFGVEPFLGSPFLADVGITWRRLNGELVTVFPEGRTNIVDVTVSPVLNTGGFCYPDDPETLTINEFLTSFAGASIETAGGRAVVFVRSLDIPGQTTVHVAARDPDTDETVQAELTFTITNGTSGLPSNIGMTRDTAPVYINGSGGNTSARYDVSVTDGAAAPVRDPVSGTTRFNNVQAEIVGGAQLGEKLAGISASGASVRDGQIRFFTANGLTNFVYQAGTRVGNVPIRVTVDRADNNVDNGIQDPTFVTQSVVVGDGRLFDLDITSPIVNAIRINPFSEETEPLFDGGPEVPPLPDGTYSLTVAALATDRFGNPVVPGTEIRFGVVDHPQTDGFFAIGGNDGNPGEGTTSFTAPTGTFQTSGGGAGPGDTLLVFGEELNGNRDLESARTVASVNSQTSLTTTYRFNFNDDTGAPVNNGAIFPYIIGRATDGNVSSVVPIDGAPQTAFGAAAFTDFNGVARVTLNYPTNKLGKLAAVFAQGTGDIVSNSQELVTDVELLRYAGVAPGTISVVPSTIPGNRTTPVTICVEDALGYGLQGLFFDFRFENMNAATGSVNGIAAPGTLDEPTDESGCVTVDVTTGGVVNPANGTGPSVVFSLGSLQGSADITAGQMFLTASPETVTGDGGRLIDLRLIDAAGNPIPGVLITASCIASGATLTITSGPGVTNAQGRTEAVGSGQGFDVTTGAGSATGTCTFTVAGGSVSDTVTWSSQNICDVFSPAVPEGCPSATLVMNITGSGNAGSIPSGLNCTGPNTCTRFFAPATSIQLVLSAAPTTFTCQPPTGPVNDFGTSPTASILMPAAGQTITCNVTFP